MESQRIINAFLLVSLGGLVISHVAEWLYVRSIAVLARQTSEDLRTVEDVLSGEHDEA